MNVPSDQVNTPTYNRDLAAATKMLLESGASGLYNIGGSEARAPPPTQQRPPPPNPNPTHPPAPPALAHPSTPPLAPPLHSHPRPHPALAPLHSHPRPHQVLGRTDFGHAVIDALNARPGATAKPLDKALIKPVTTTNAGQAALRPLDSGLKLDKLSAALPGWKPRTVKQAMNDWLDNPMGKPLGQ